jgi:hypothetical protein
MVSSTLGICPHCSLEPVASIDFSPVLEPQGSAARVAATQQNNS